MRGKDQRRSGTGVPRRAPVAWLALLPFVWMLSCTSGSPRGPTDGGAPHQDGGLGADGGVTATVPKYGIFEPTFAWTSAGYRNPWEEVSLRMTLRSPTGRTVSIGGFYLSVDRWAARFSPDETGVWTWMATIADANRSQDYQGTVMVTASTSPGFVRIHTGNPYRLVFEDGSPYHPIGLGDCIVTSPDDPESVTKAWGFDGPLGGPEARTDIDTYLAAYRDAGFNLFRWSVDNCAFDLKKTISESENVYGLVEGQWGDTLVRKLRQYGMRVFMTFFGFRPPFPNESGSILKMDAIKRYVRYVVDRYGAYVDFWELMNEYPNAPDTIDDDWYRIVAAYLRSIDPYQHPISTSWERFDLPEIEITAPHWYRKEGELESDRVTVEQIDYFRLRQTQGHQPIIFGEQGNSERNWDERSALRMRIRSWTAFFNEAIFIFWNQSSLKSTSDQGIAANIYLGPDERAYVKVLQDFTAGFDPGAVRAAVTTSEPSRVRGYALRGATTFALYLHAYTDHHNPTTGVRVTIDPPSSGTVRWIDPATGTVLGTATVGAGTQTLDVPAFTIDVAMKIE